LRRQTVGVLASLLFLVSSGCSEEGKRSSSSPFTVASVMGDESSNDDPYELQTAKKGGDQQVYYVGEAVLFTDRKHSILINPGGQMEAMEEHIINEGHLELDWLVLTHEDAHGFEDVNEYLLANPYVNVLSSHEELLPDLEQMVNRELHETREDVPKVDVGNFQIQVLDQRDDLILRVLGGGEAYMFYSTQEEAWEERLLETYGDDVDAFTLHIHSESKEEAYPFYQAVNPLYVIHLSDDAPTPWQEEFHHMYSTSEEGWRLTLGSEADASAHDDHGHGHTHPHDDEEVGHSVTPLEESPEPCIPVNTTRFAYFENIPDLTEEDIEFIAFNQPFDSLDDYFNQAGFDDEKQAALVESNLCIQEDE